MVNRAQEIYPFDTSEQKALYQKVIAELRCTVCQNQSLSESQAPLAIDLRDKVYQQVLKGQNESELIEFAKSRYGNFVSYDPPFDNTTVVLWFGPIMISVLGIVWFIRKLGFSRPQDR